jgi:hypothetical protein
MVVEFIVRVLALRPRGYEFEPHSEDSHIRFKTYFSLDKSSAFGNWSLGQKQGLSVTTQLLLLKVTYV